MPRRDGDDEPSESTERWLDLPRDSESAFYWSPRFSSPEATYAEVRDRLGVLLDGLAERPWRRFEGEIDPDRIARLHRGIFRSTFPEEAGRFRSSEPSRYGVLLIDRPEDAWRWTSVRGATPEEIDGNMRAGAALLATGLWRFGYPRPRLLPHDLEMAVGLSYALRPEGATNTRLAETISKRVRQRLSGTESE